MTGPALRNLYLARSGFSALWVFLVLSLASAGNAGLLSGFLLTLYPVSDAAATVFDLRRAGAWWPQRVNLGADLAASVTILVALRSGLTAAITAFGAWAMLSGILMIVLAVHRQRFLGGQWLLILSGRARCWLASHSWAGPGPCLPTSGEAPAP